MGKEKESFKIKVEEPNVLRVKALCTFGSNQEEPIYGAIFDDRSYAKGDSEIFYDWIGPFKFTLWQRFLRWLDKIFGTHFAKYKECSYDWTRIDVPDEIKNNSLAISDKEIDYDTCYEYDDLKSR